ncbi:helix-turn-helix transcriptional regulator [Rugosimonospora africana]|uniref:Transcriptional regulator n=1 Tax=Rugosimonospora africana TaxID=556532 RepID=A0A8J3VR51_9ACTN|nr:LuxR C-terminal-related transcriptional regulator [Rugosimonospora africana]GIH15732.1 transcriptional regulator [Rugosimonospora africana]
MLDNLVSRRAFELYQRLLAGEHHMLKACSSTPEKLDGAARELLDAGLARVQDGTPPLLVSVAPALAAQTVLGQMSARISSWQDETASIVRQLIRLQRDALRVGGYPIQELAEVVTDPTQVLSLVDDIQLGARHELLSLDTTASAGSACHPRVSPAIEHPPPVWRTVFSTDFTTPEFSWVIDSTLTGGGAVRISAGLPMKLLIADRARALVPLDESGSAGVVLFRSPTVIGALAELFQSLWERATPYPPERERPDGLTPYQRHVLSLLATGCKDEEIAARTHVSIRTVRRNVAAILDHLGMATRFAAGVQAAKRGWI